MKILLLCHSSTGNTRLVARFAARHLARLGHEVAFHELGRGTPPDPVGFELIGVASPTMYFRPMFAVEAWIDGLAALPGATLRPAFLLCTCAGEPGAHFELQARQLRQKGLQVLGAHWVAMPSNWPPHRVLSRAVEPGLPLGRLLIRGPLRPLRVGLGFVWAELTEPDARDRRELEDFLAAMPAAAARRPWAPPAPEALYRAWLPGARLAGRKLGPREARKSTQVRIDPGICERCGTCVRACPSGCLTWPDESAPPRMGSGCTGCWACYNHCPHKAIAGWGSPPGLGRYPGPSAPTRALFADEPR
ncbi:MAG TPA: 4Fe-4S binding protein [Myxococcota bacterium]|nr:4Fe-4S binding protein [Myxococcota bacterium]HRY95604.1 4Fe-4S binding protein [Myxococcota bacterium]HSA20140.1 4Fe-4S binding protein [Myxococcota bacterium]